MINYPEVFPVPAAARPPLLTQLLSPVATSHPEFLVEVSRLSERDPYGAEREHCQMIVASVPEADADKLGVFSECSNGVVSFSTPDVSKKGQLHQLQPGISGYDYIVASWGDGSRNAFNLSEKVWMTLGLSPRCIGNDSQTLVYDDLASPVVDVARGEVSNSYYWTQSRNVTWVMRNDYLRRYLWMRGQVGVRAFFYEALLDDREDLRAIMSGESHFTDEPQDGWYQLDIREHEGGLLLQLWATVVAVLPELCPYPDPFELVWPGDSTAMTESRAKTIFQGDFVHLDDRFLRKYERSKLYSSTPIRSGNSWYCSPSYGGQWSFSDCQRVGRNLIRVPVRKLYSGLPAAEIVHAHAFSVSPDMVSQSDQAEEHIVSKVQRLLDQLLTLGDMLSRLSQATDGEALRPEECVGISRDECRRKGWDAYPILGRLAQVASLDLDEQDFLARCKTLHELVLGIRTGPLKRLLKAAGCPAKDLGDMQSLKLIQSLTNIIESMNNNLECVNDFDGCANEINWRRRNNRLASLFVNNDLRISDAHEATGKGIQELEVLGFDSQSLNSGYGRALDFIIDGVVASLAHVNDQACTLLAR